MINRFKIKIVVIAICGISLLSCKKFVEIDPPRTDLVKITVFQNDATANAAMIGIYYDMMLTGPASSLTNSITYFGTTSSDEQIEYSVASYQEFNTNELSPSNGFVLSLWSQMYTTIYRCNSLLEGLTNSNGLSGGLKLQLQGEAKFVRAFTYFYLVNLFGDVPLVLTTDYHINATITRTPSVQIYQQIINDLKDAQNLLPLTYSFAGNERVRPNVAAATAILARSYLHQGDWINAEAEATKIIQNTSLYSLVPDLNDVFRKNSTEAIFQFHTTFWPNDYFTFNVVANNGGPGYYGAFRPAFVNNFEANDQRRTKWVRSIVIGSTTYYFPGKYKNVAQAEEYSTLFRLAEVYLMRAEARAQLNNISGSQSDINMIRQRAGLPITYANDRPSLLTAIEHERITELFTEQGLRWLDLKRTNRANTLLAQLKGATWQPTDVLYPIPQTQILNNPNTTQNPGY